MGQAWTAQGTNTAAYAAAAVVADLATLNAKGLVNASTPVLAEAMEAIPAHQQPAVATVACIVTAFRERQGIALHPFYF